MLYNIYKKSEKNKKKKKNKKTFETETWKAHKYIYIFRAILKKMFVCCTPTLYFLVG